VVVEISLGVAAGFGHYVSYDQTIKQSKLLGPE
jgi:hypothetical protein